LCCFVSIEEEFSKNSEKLFFLTPCFLKKIVFLMPQLHLKIDDWATLSLLEALLAKLEGVQVVPSLGTETENNAEVAIEALTQLTKLPSVFPEPLEWQREERNERNLPGREA
jgi:hypothetical protein